MAYLVKTVASLQIPVYSHIRTVPLVDSFVVFSKVPILHYEPIQPTISMLYPYPAN